MDALTLRLILLVVGAAFLVGLYFWERRRAEDRDESVDWDDYLGVPRQEPSLGELEPSGADVWADELDIDDDPRRGDDHASLQPTDDVPTEPVADPDGAGDADEDEDMDEVASPNPLLIQLFVVSTGAPFSGERIEAIAGRLGLTLGSMDIFHCRASDDGDRAPLFSMANLVKPGSFPVEDMDTFETPGLALFAQLRGDTSDLMVFDELLHAARTLAAELHGELRQRGRQPLTDADARAMRAQVSALLRPPGDPADTE